MGAHLLACLAALLLSFPRASADVYAARASIGGAMYTWTPAQVASFVAAVPLSQSTAQALLERNTTGQQLLEIDAHGLRLAAGDAQGLAAALRLLRSDPNGRQPSHEMRLRDLRFYNRLRFDQGVIWVTACPHLYLAYAALFPSNDALQLFDGGWGSAASVARDLVFWLLFPEAFSFMHFWRFTDTDGCVGWMLALPSAGFALIKLLGCAGLAWLHRREGAGVLAFLQDTLARYAARCWAAEIYHGVPLSIVSFLAAQVLHWLCGYLVSNSPRFGGSKACARCPCRSTALSLFPAHFHPAVRSLRHSR